MAPSLDALLESQEEEPCAVPLLKRIRAWLESVINHLVVVGILSLLADQYLKPNGKCPTTLFYESIHDPYINGDNIRLEHGITYRMPPEGILYIGGSLAVLGVGMLLFGLKMQQTISAVATIAGAAFLAEELAMRSLLLIPKEDRYTLVTDLNQGPLTKHRFNVDVSCASSIFATLIAIAAALNLVAMYIFKRAANFFEGAVCAVLIVRLAAQFVPWLLMTHPLAGPDYLGHYFVGYPLVPFWACAVPLAFVIGAFNFNVRMQAVVTTFLGAFAATKGIKMIHNALTGETNIELAGGDDVHSDPVQGLAQLGLFVFGLLVHQQLWLKHETDSCGCSPCCSGAVADDEAEEEEQLQRSAELLAKRRQSLSMREKRASAMLQSGKTMF